jgi:uncharacterized protein YigE (DUF2233 family)
MSRKIKRGILNLVNMKKTFGLMRFSQMNFFVKYSIFVLIILGVSLLISVFFHGPPRIISAKFNPKIQNIRFFWKNSKGDQFKNIGGLHYQLDMKGDSLVFASNAGMFDESFAPMGLYIEKGVTKKSLNTRLLSSESGNFYIQPNGVFYIKNNRTAGICETQKYPGSDSVEYATQSGPMLLLNGVINSAFDPGSTNYQIRNGVGITDKGEVVFAISDNEVTFYDFAAYFKKKGCVNALYLDGYVSKFFYPQECFVQHDGELGVLIGITERANAKK